MEGTAMNRNALYMIIGGLVVLVVVLGVYVYDKETRPEGVELKIGEGGISIQEN
ncbi:hypothetical protein OIU34_25290 [Pararhizobium sp. BT-229]|uniref:hypothetical protein n=1 Tax=Pararhizobium sp. BT-229 TaxID=2986923 RepID=UPI0021F7D13C|nr:hypothetical protein [Pararhizobium sp. BT-229]MCV9965197.1 hypothetical protein [Pararhizobium sp. BT-229]